MQIKRNTKSNLSKLKTVGSAVIRAIFCKNHVPLPIYLNFQFTIIFLVLSDCEFVTSNVHCLYLIPITNQCKMNLADPELELIDPTPNIHSLFMNFDKTFFWSKLAAGAVVRWSKRMYSCAGVCS